MFHVVFLMFRAESGFWREKTDILSLNSSRRGAELAKNAKPYFVFSLRPWRTWREKMGIVFYRIKIKEFCMKKQSYFAHCSLVTAN
jgi:hypothetical protein